MSNDKKKWTLKSIAAELGVSNATVSNAFNRPDQLSKSKREEILKAFSVQNDKLYPYVLIDMTNKARVNGLKIYLDYFSKYKVVLVDLMKYYLVPEQDAIQFKKQKKNIEDPPTTPIEPSNCRPRISKRDRREYFDRKIKRIVRKYHRKSFLLGQN